MILLSVKRWRIISKESTSAAVDQFCGHVSQIMKNTFELTGGLMDLPRQRASPDEKAVDRGLSPGPLRPRRSKQLRSSLLFEEK
jgi:hypothetical protein